jgi:AcrR family transcriptional regulator
VFADVGFDAATIRDITVAAQANTAAVNYYFRSKDDLVQSVLTEAIQPIAEARIAALEQRLKSSEGKPLALEEIAEAFVRPMVELGRDKDGSRSPVRLLLQVRALPRPLTNSLVAKHFDFVHQLFQAEFGRSAPQIEPHELALRYVFARGAVMQILADLDPAARELPSLASTQRQLDDEDAIRYLVAFIAQGFRAPPAKSTAKRPRRKLSSQNRNVG